MPLFRRRRGRTDDAERRTLAERLNHAAQDVLDGDVLLPRGRSHARDEEVARTGEAVEATVTGIATALDGDGMARTTVEVAWTGGATRLAFAALQTPPVVRLGASLPLRTGDGRAVLDRAALVAVHPRPTLPGGIVQGPSVTGTGPPPPPVARPDDGVVDRAIDLRIQRAWADWTPGRATITGLEQRSTLLGPTASFHVDLRLAGGGAARSVDDPVPTYGMYLAVAGADVPVVVDPDDPRSARIVWPALAAERRGGRWRDRPPEGSVAATLLGAAASPGPVSGVAGGGDPGSGAGTAPTAAGAIEGVTLERWAIVEAALTVGRVPPAEHDAVATRDHGVPAGRWTAIRAAWSARQSADWRIGAAFGEAYAAAFKDAGRRARAERRR